MKMLRLQEIVIGFCFLGFIGCSSSSHSYNMNNNSESYPIKNRKYSKEQVYNRLMVSYPPSPLPALNIQQPVNRPRILPVIHLKLKNSQICNAALVLATATRYRSYCSYKVKDKRVTINDLGIVDELAEKIGKISHTKVVVDHINREIRVLAVNQVKPKFLKKEKNG